MIESVPGLLPGARVPRWMNAASVWRVPPPDRRVVGLKTLGDLSAGAKRALRALRGRADLLAALGL